MEKIGQILSRFKNLSEEDLVQAEQKGKDTHKPIGTVLVLSQKISEQDLYQALAIQYAREFVELGNKTLNFSPQKFIPRKFAEKHLCFPFEKDGSKLKVAIADPRNFELIPELEFLTQSIIETAVASESDIIKAIEENYGGQNLLKESAQGIARGLNQNDLKDGAACESIEALKRETESEPIVRIVNLIMDDAIRNSASDIHIEPHESSLHIRNRIDGMLLEMMDMPEWMQNPITSRIKILANLDIAEKRIPQDGRIKRIVDGEEIDMRVSVLPTHHGEKTVIRILRHNATLLQLESLGLENENLDVAVDWINKPQGMLFITGPTGSGKSSTLFACLNRIKHKAINIVTIEDPIEYKLQGVNQVQINEKAGLTFADTLRSILRQDPDVILVGEIRDTETAQIALQASQTGHLVFSTLHTNDSVSAITRLRDLGIPPFLIASGVLGVIAQRLVRIICSNCKEICKPSEEIAYRYKMITHEDHLPTSYIGKGCKKCNNTGYKGRTGIFEFLKMDTDIREMISQDQAEHKIRDLALQRQMKKLIHHGIEKVNDGTTSIEELLRVVLTE